MNSMLRPQSSCMFWKTPNLHKKVEEELALASKQMPQVKPLIPEFMNKDIADKIRLELRLERYSCQYQTIGDSEKNDDELLYFSQN